MTNKVLIDYAIERIRIIAETAHRLSTGNVSHVSKNIEGQAKRLYEFLEKHKNKESNEETI
jgi:hypothetical protein